jgi:hypothetical protein
VDFTTAAFHNGFSAMNFPFNVINKKTKTLDFLFLSSFIKGEVVISMQVMQAPFCDAAKCKFTII